MNSRLAGLQDNDGRILALTWWNCFYSEMAVEFRGRRSSCELEPARGGRPMPWSCQMTQYLISFNDGLMTFPEIIDQRGKTGSCVMRSN